MTLPSPRRVKVYWLRTQHGRLLISISISAKPPPRPFRFCILPPLPLKTSDIFSVIPCPCLLIQPPPHPISELFSMLPWRSTQSKVGKISATTHSPPRSMAVTAPILFLIYSKNKPGCLTNSGRVIPNCSSGLDLSSMCCMPSLLTKSLKTALVM